jgi:hypothetical protein
MIHANPSLVITPHTKQSTPNTVHPSKARRPYFPLVRSIGKTKRADVLEWGDWRVTKPLDFTAEMWTVDWRIGLVMKICWGDESVAG